MIRSYQQKSSSAKGVEARRSCRVHSLLIMLVSGSSALTGAGSDAIRQLVLVLRVPDGDKVEQKVVNRRWQTVSERNHQ